MANLVDSDSFTNLLDSSSFKKCTGSFCIPGFCDRRAHRKYDPEVSALVSKIRTSDDPLIESLRSANNAFKAGKTKENLYYLAGRVVKVASKELKGKDDCLVEKAEQVSHAILKGWISDNNRYLLQNHIRTELLVS